MGALTSLHVGKNGILEKEMREIMTIAMRMDSMKILCEVPFKDKTLTELDVSGKNLGTEGALVVAEYLDGNGAMMRLNLSDNCIGGHDDEPGVHALADMLKSNTTLTEFNISSNSLDKECAQMLAPAIKDNGALTSLNLADNSLGEMVEGLLPDGWKSKDDDDAAPWLRIDDGHEHNEHPNVRPQGIIAIANVIKDMRALTTLILKDNKLLTPEAGKVLAGMLAANTVLKELDVSSNTWQEHGWTNGNGPGFAKELAVGISHNGALLSLDISSCNLGQLVPPDGWQLVAPGPDGEGYYDGPNGEQSKGPPEGSKAEGVIVLANAIKDVGAMTSLNLASNKLGIKGATIIGEAIKVIRNKE
jgi:hypothetical protein